MPSPIPPPNPAANAAARQSWLAHIGDQQAFNKELSKILTDAAREGERIIVNTIGDAVGKQMRVAQYKLAVAQLDQLSAQMWGKITPAMQRGLAKSADTAVDGLLAIDKILARSLANPALRESLLGAAKNSVANVRSRLLNDIPLSPAVYQTKALSDGWIQQEVNRGIALNKSAKEIANSVRKFIRPDVKGGVSYAAQRLGRTELNNAFHTTTIRGAADQPWIVGFKWNLSGSHPEPDICNEYAEQDRDGLGAGIFDKKNTPGKPHPQCLCYITTIAVPDEEFLDGLVSGKYDKFLEDNGASQLSSQVKLVPPKLKPVKKLATAKKPATSPMQDAVSKLNAGKKNPALPADLQEGIRQWTAGSNDFADKLKKAYTTGKSPTDPAARALMEAMDAAGPAPIELFRGMRLRDFDAESFANSLSIGKEVDFPISSWTSSRDIANQFALKSSQQVGSLTIEVRRGAQALRIDTTGANMFGATQKEWLVQGKMKVVDRVVDGKNVHVVLEIPQKAVPGIREVGRDEFRDIFDTFTDPQRPDIYLQSNQYRKQIEAGFGDPVDAYSGGRYGEINKGMRTGTFTEDSYAQDAKGLQQAFNSDAAVPLPLKKVYRGVSGDNVGTFLSPGDVMQDDGFVSTTDLFNLANRFLNARLTSPTTIMNQTVFVIKPAPGVASKVLAGNISESEWILPPGSKFTVGNITSYTNPNGGIQRIIDLEWTGT